MPAEHRCDAGPLQNDTVAWWRGELGDFVRAWIGCADTGERGALAILGLMLTTARLVRPDQAIAYHIAHVADDIKAILERAVVGRVDGGDVRFAANGHDPRRVHDVQPVRA